MLFIFAYDDKKKYMLEFELPYKEIRDGMNRCEMTHLDEFETYIDVDNAACKYNRLAVSNFRSATGVKVVFPVAADGFGQSVPRILVVKISTAF